MWNPSNRATLATSETATLVEIALSVSDSVAPAVSGGFIHQREHYARPVNPGGS